MINADTLTEIGNLVRQAKNSIIFLRSKPSSDQVLTALALATSLTQAGQHVELACSDLGILEAGKLSGEATGSGDGSDFDDGTAPIAQSDLAQIKQKIGNRNLTVSFPYNEQSVDSVSYHISDDGDKFYLVIKPQSGAQPLVADQVEFDYSGVEADVIFTIGVHDWEQLEYLYEAHQLLIRNAPVVSLHSVESELTPFNLDTSAFGSMSEALVWFFEGLQLSPTAQGATYLLRGIEMATDSFRSLATTADTFESVAKLMRMGARRAPKPKPTQQILPNLSNTQMAQQFKPQLQTNSANSFITQSATSSTSTAKSSTKKSQPKNSVDLQMPSRSRV